MTVRISRALLDRILAQAAADPDREVCGLLLGEPERVEDIIPTRNVAPDPARAFEIDPAALFAAIRAERDGGARLIGHYHSHPNGSPVPSPRDAEAAREQGRLWLIAAAGEARAWRAATGGRIEGAFDPVTLKIEGQAVAIHDGNRHKGRAAGAADQG